MPISADLGIKLEAYVDTLVASGRYNSKSEVIREGLRLLQDRETKLKFLDEAIEKGMADAHAGRLLPADEVFSELRERYVRMAKERS
jgi:antitoxin ParD1/3/4